MTCIWGLIIVKVDGKHQFVVDTTYKLKKAMAPHSSTLAWKIPRTEEPSGLQSMGSLRVGHDWATSLWLFTFMHWRRKWHPLQCSCLENPGTGQPGGLLSMGSKRVGHDWSDLAAAAATYKESLTIFFFLRKQCFVLFFFLLGLYSLCYIWTTHDNYSLCSGMRVKLLMHSLDL